MNASVLVAIFAVVAAFAVGVLFDWVSARGAGWAKRLLVVCFIALHGFALYKVIVADGRFGVPVPLKVAAWLFVAVFVMLLAYSLVLELPAGKTYGSGKRQEKLITTGTYALTRHPGVLWYTLALGWLIIAIGSRAMLIAAPVWALLNIAYTTLQEKVFLVKGFPDYRDYIRRTPMFVPTVSSIRACMATIRNADSAPDKGAST